MPKRYRIDGPPAEKENTDINISSYLRNSEEPRMSNRRIPECHRQNSRIDSGVGESLTEAVDRFIIDSDNFDSDIDEDVFNFDEIDSQEALIVDVEEMPNLTSTPIRPPRDPNRLYPHDFNRRNGTLTPQSWQRLRTMSECSNEEFETLRNGPLSHPGLQHDIIAARLSVLADEIAPFMRPGGVTSPPPPPPVLRRDLITDEEVDMIAARIRLLALLIDQHFYRPPLFPTRRLILAGCVVAAVASVTYLWLKS